MTTPPRPTSARAPDRTVCSVCRTAPATHLITTPAGTTLACPTCRPIDLIPAAGPTDPVGEFSPAVTR